MLQPVRTKFRKAFKGRIHGNASRAVKLNYGQYGLKAMEPERIIGKQIELLIANYEPRARLVTVRTLPQFDRNAYAVTINFQVVNQPEPIVVETLLERLR